MSQSEVDLMAFMQDVRIELRNNDPMDQAADAILQGVIDTILENGETTGAACAKLAARLCCKYARFMKEKRGEKTDSDNIELPKFKELTKKFATELIKTRLAKFHFHQGKTAISLGLLRSTLAYKMRLYGISGKLCKHMKEATREHHEMRKMPSLE